jgi:hypothetical protein
MTDNAFYYLIVTPSLTFVPMTPFYQQGLHAIVAIMMNVLVFGKL